MPKLLIIEITMCRQCPHYLEDGNGNDKCSINNIEVLDSFKIPTLCPLEDLYKAN